MTDIENLSLKHKELAEILSDTKDFTVQSAKLQRWVKETERYLDQHLPLETQAFKNISLGLMRLGTKPQKDKNLIQGKRYLAFLVALIESIEKKPSTYSNQQPSVLPTPVLNVEESDKGAISKKHHAEIIALFSFGLIFLAIPLAMLSSHLDRFFWSSLVLIFMFLGSFAAIFSRSHRKEIALSWVVASVFLLMPTFKEDLKDVRAAEQKASEQNTSPLPNPLPNDFLEIIVNVDVSKELFETTKQTADDFKIAAVTYNKAELGFSFTLILPKEAKLIELGSPSTEFYLEKQSTESDGIHYNYILSSGMRQSQYTFPIKIHY